MTTLQENQLCFDFPGVLRAWHFDESRKARKLAGSWRSVDFVVDTDDYLFLIEVKDPGGPHVPQKNRDEFCQNIKDLKDSKDNDKVRDAFLGQYRDKFLHSLAFLGIDEGVPKKPLHYVIFISIDDSLLVPLADKMKKRGILGHVKDWNKKFDVSVLNFTQWNKQMPQMFPHWKVRRVI